MSARERLPPRRRATIAAEGWGGGASGDRSYFPPPPTAVGVKMSTEREKELQEGQREQSVYTGIGPCKTKGWFVWLGERDETPRGAGGGEERSVRRISFGSCHLLPNLASLKGRRRRRLRACLPTGVKLREGFYGKRCTGSVVR